MPQHIPHTPRRSRHSHTARRDAESPAAMGTVAALSGHHRCRSTQQPRCGSQRCAAFRGFVVPVPPPPARLAGGKTSAHTMHQQPGQLDAGREAHSLAYMPVPLIDRPDSISRHAVHSQHSSQQSSAVISHHHLSHLRLAAMFAHVMCMHCARGLATVSGALPWVHGARQGVSPGARQPALRGKPRSVLGAIVERG